MTSRGSELIAESEETYVELAVRLAQDAASRKRIRNEIKQASHPLFEDRAPIRALEHFLGEVARAADRDET